MAKNKKENQKEVKDPLAVIKDNISKKYGPGVFMGLEERDVYVEDISVIPTGSIGLNQALGVGGFPRGRIIEIYGQESTGKTLILLNTIAQAQKAGERAAVIDLERALDIKFSRKLGVDTSQLDIAMVESAEDALSLLEDLVNSKLYSIIGVDSVAALVPQAEIDGEMGDSHMGLTARLMGQSLRKLTPIISKNNVSVVFINQIRQKIGKFFGSPNTTTGGNALKFYSSVRLEVKKMGLIKEGSGELEKVIGAKTLVKVAKNKVGPPFRECVFDVFYDFGLDNIGEVFDYGLLFGFIEKSGAWYSYNNERHQGKANFTKVLKENIELFEGLKSQVVERMI